jgi:large subunit ribosomal protein L6
MSRIGNKIINIPQSIEVKFEGNLVKIKGPKGSMERLFPASISIKKEDNIIIVKRNSNEPKVRALHGCVRNLLANMIKGVSEGFEKILEINGIGYKAQLAGNKLNLILGFSHPIEVTPPQGIAFAVEGVNKIFVRGFDKELVGQTAANIRRLKEVEPYKAKGIKYANEYVRRKAGKSGKVGAAAAA